MKSRHRGHFCFPESRSLSYRMAILSFSMQSPDFGICFNNWFVDIRSYLIFSIRLHALEWTKDRLHQNLEYKSHFTGESSWQIDCYQLKRIYDGMC